MRKEFDQGNTHGRYITVCDEGGEETTIFAEFVYDEHANEVRDVEYLYTGKDLAIPITEVIFQVMCLVLENKHEYVDNGF